MSFEEQRSQMINTQLRPRGIRDARVLSAFAKVPRHLFIAAEYQDQAYADRPLPIGYGQTISQPYMVALMTSCLQLQGHERVLEIGTGSGYQAAVLAELALEVYSVERLPDLHRLAAQKLEDLGYRNVTISTGNGTIGWPAHAPFDAIVVAAAAPEIPSPLLEQLADPGRLIVPVGDPNTQYLVTLTKKQGMIREEKLASCVFVPLLGQHGWPETS